MSKYKLQRHLYRGRHGEIIFAISLHGFISCLTSIKLPQVLYIQLVKKCISKVFPSIHLVRHFQSIIRSISPFGSVPCHYDGCNIRNFYSFLLQIILIIYDKKISFLVNPPNNCCDVTTANKITLHLQFRHYSALFCYFALPSCSVDITYY